MWFLLPKPCVIFAEVLTLNEGGSIVQDTQKAKKQKSMNCGRNNYAKLLNETEIMTDIS
jgi:hypothetical protein